MSQPPEKPSRPVRHVGHIPTRIRQPAEPKTNAFREAEIANGRVELEQVVGICRAIGSLLQAVPKEQRKFTVTRLGNVAKVHRENGDSPLTYLSIEALIAGWEDWP